MHNNAIRTIDAGIELTKIVTLYAANRVKNQPSVILETDDGANVYMYLAAFMGDLELLQLAVKYGADITSCNEDGTVLHAIALGSGFEFYNQKLLDFVMTSDIDLYAKNSSGKTALTVIEEVLSDLEQNAHNANKAQKVLIHLLAKQSELEMQKIDQLEGDSLIKDNSMLPGDECTSEDLLTHYDSSYSHPDTAGSELNADQPLDAQIDMI